MVVSMRVQRSLRAHATAPSLAREAIVDLSAQVPAPAAQDLRLRRGSRGATLQGSISGSTLWIRFSP